MAVNSLERSFAILELFTEERLEWTPEEMMAALGYSRATLYRYLKTLRETGLLTSLPGAGFTLGPRIVEMDFLLRKSDPLIRAAQPHLERLASLQPATALVVRWYGARILCVASECSTPNPVSSYPRGRPMPLARGAISRSILAFLPRRQLGALVAAHLADFGAIGLGRTAAEVHARLRDVRRQGFAVARGEVTAGVVGIAAPIFDASETPIASLCMTIEAATLTEPRIAELAGAIRTAATTLSDQLARRRPGGDPSAPERALEPVGEPS